MHTELTNLLPDYRKRFLTRDYLFRLGTVAVWLLAFLVFVHGLLLLPSYLYVHQQVAVRGEQLATLQQAASTASQQELATRVTALETRAKQLSALGVQTAGSAAIRGVLAAPRPGIKIVGFTYAPAAADANRMTIVGVASTRDALKSYLETLSALPFVTKAELPISAYAEVTNIGFTITLTGSLRP